MVFINAVKQSPFIHGTRSSRTTIALPHVATYMIHNEHGGRARMKYKKSLLFPNATEIEKANSCNTAIHKEQKSGITSINQ